MDFLKSLIFGLVSGITEFFPVSQWAHGLLLAKMFGKENVAELWMLSAHLGGLVAVILLTSGQWKRISREQKIYRAPQRKRPRPADGKTILQLRLLKKSGLILGIVMVLTAKMGNLAGNLGWVSLLLFFNGLILFLSERFPRGNKDGRSIAAVDGVLIGAGGALGALPGISFLGSSLCVALLRGFDAAFALENCLLLAIPGLAGCILGDLIRMISAGVGGFSVGTAASCLLVAGSTFAGAFYGITGMRRMAERRVFFRFAFYSWGLALFSFILYLTI